MKSLCSNSFHPADVLFHDNGIKQLAAAAPNNSPKKVTNNYSQTSIQMNVSFRFSVRDVFSRVVFRVSGYLVFIDIK